MGSDPAPFIANLFLYLYENRFMNKLKKEDLRRARKLRHVFRFIDDLIALNDDDEFLRSDAEIYLKEMELKPENQSTESGSYLDLDLKIDEKSDEKSQLRSQKHRKLILSKRINFNPLSPCCDDLTDSNFISLESFHHTLFFFNKNHVFWS